MLKQNKVQNQYMNKCQHNLQIEHFCISQHCESKQPGGCQQCIKKYHTHYREQKLIREQQLLNIVKTFTISQQLAKQNCRNIQQSIYSYFSQLKNQLIVSLDILCKTVINSLGAPYLMQNQLFNCYKRVKNKEYRRLQQKEVRRFIELGKKVNEKQLVKEQARLYKQSLKKYMKFLNSLQGVMSTYQSLAKQVNQSYRHQKTPYQNVTALMKQSSQLSDTPMSIAQFHQKQMQRNQKTSTIGQKGQQQQLKEKSSLLLQGKMSVSQALSVQKRQVNQVSGLMMMSQQFSSGMSTVREKSGLGLGNVQKKEVQSGESTAHKFGVRDFCQLDKAEKKQTVNSKRPVSLQRTITTPNYSNVLSALNQKKRNNTDLIQQLKGLPHQGQSVQKQRIYLKDKKNESMLEQFFAAQPSNSTKSYGLNGKTSVKKTLQQNYSVLSRERRDLSLKESEINSRKQQLIQMMRGISSGTKNIFDKERGNINNSSNLPQSSNLTQTPNPSLVKQPQSKISQQTKMSQQIKSNIIPIRSTTVQKPSNLKRTGSSMIQSKPSPPPPLPQSKPLQKPLLNSMISPKIAILQIDSISNIQMQNSTSSYEQENTIQRLFPNNAHLKLPGCEERKKELVACSRLVIVPTYQELPPVKKENEGGMALLVKSVPTGRDVRQDRNDQQKPLAKAQRQRKGSFTQCPPDPKQQLTQPQRQSLSLLIKAIRLPPPQAIPLLQLSLKQSPNNLSSAQYLSYLYLQTSKPKEALTVCNLILDRFEITTKQNQQLLINLENNKSAALNMLGRYSESVVLLEKCIKFKEKDTLLKNLGDAYYFGSNYQKAVYYYQKATKLSPNYDQASYNLAVCFYLQNNFHNAKQYITKALENSLKNNDYLQLKRNVQEKINHLKNDQKPTKFL